MTFEEFELLMEEYEAKAPTEKALYHFGYKENTKCLGYWDKLDHLNQIFLLPERADKEALEKIFQRFGYLEDKENTEYLNCQNKSKYLERLFPLLEYINKALKNKRFKLVFDYDPDYPDTLIQIFLKE